MNDVLTAKNLKKVNGPINVFILKLIALAAMLIDHLEGSFPNTFPVAFGWLGRVAIPLFMFCIIQGLIHTSNRRKYLFRLYIGSVIMTAGSLILQTAFFRAQFQIADNIFATFFLLALLITLAEGKLTMNKKIGLWIVFILIQIVSFLLVKRLQTMSAYYAYLANGLIPNILTCEGSVIFIVLGIFMYVFKSNRVKFTVMYVIFCILMFVSAGFAGFTVQNLFYGNYQWMMIVALPLMLCYNGEKGKSMKYFFYTFYPLHTWILFVISNLLQKR